MDVDGRIEQCRDRMLLERPAVDTTGCLAVWRSKDAKCAQVAGFRGLRREPCQCLGRRSPAVLAGAASLRLLLRRSNRLLGGELVAQRPNRLRKLLEVTTHRIQLVLYLFGGHAGVLRLT